MAVTEFRGALDELPEAEPYSGDTDEERAKSPSALDYLKQVGTGFVSDTAKGLGWVAEKAGIDYGTRMRKAGDWLEQELLTSMTPGGRRAATTPMFDGGLSDLKVADKWGQSLLMGAARSLPSTVMMAPVGGPLAAGVAKVIPKAAQAATGLTGLLARNAPGGIGFGVAEGIQSGALNAADFQTEIESNRGDPAKIAKLASTSPRFRALLAEHDPDTALELLAAEGSNQVFLRTAPWTGGVSLLTGGGALGELVKPGARFGLKEVVKGIGRGALTETMQEAPQSGGEAYISGAARRDFIDKSVDPSKDVVGQTLTGGAIGGLTGGVFGGAAHVGGRPETEDPNGSLSKMRELARQMKEETARQQAERTVKEVKARAEAVGATKKGTADGNEPIVNAPANATGTQEASAAGTQEVTAAPQADVLSGETVDAAAHEAASSPENERPEPTTPQIAANNAKLGHPTVDGMDVSIENPAGSTRTDKKNDPPLWSVEMQDVHYGYLRGTQGFDKDHLDVFVKKGTPKEWTGTYFVVNQNRDDGAFDEHKPMAGYASEEEAREAYLRNYDNRAKAEKRIGSIVSMPSPQFKAWAFDKSERGPKGGELKAPVAGIATTVAETRTNALEMRTAAITKGAPNAETVRGNEEQIRQGSEEGQPGVQRGAVEGDADLQRAAQAGAEAGLGKEAVGRLLPAERRARAAAKAAEAKITVPEDTHEMLRTMAANAGHLERGGRAVGAGTAFDEQQGIRSRSEMNAEGAWRTVFAGQPEWAKGFSATPEDVKAAVEKAIAGKPLGAKQKDIVKAMLAEVKATRENLSQAEALSAEAGEVPDSWRTMTEEEKDDHLDKLFGEDTRVPAGAKTGAEADAGAVGPASEAEAEPAGEREPGEDREEVVSASAEKLTQTEQNRPEVNRPAPAAPPKRELEGSPALALAGETEEEVQRKETERTKAEEEKRRREAAPPAEEFKLAGSDRAADQAAAKGQQDLLATAANALRTAADTIEKAAKPVQNVGTSAQEPTNRSEATTTPAEPSGPATTAEQDKAPYEVASPWYSDLTRKLEDLKRASGTAQEWKAIIAQLPGVKKDEVEWSGVNEWLALQTGKVEKSALLDFLAENGVRVEETVLGGESAAEYDAAARKAATLSEQQAVMWREIDVTIPPIRGVDRMNLPWWAHEMHDPSAYGAKEAEEKARAVGLNDEQIEKLRAYGKVREEYIRAEEARKVLKDAGARTKFETYTLPGGKNYRELLLTLPESIVRRSEGKNDPVQRFRSPHFDQPNVLAHVRFNERVDAEGRKVLFIEEWQSDWSAKGRRDGFQGESQNYKVEQQKDGTWSAADDGGGGEGGFSTRTEAQAWADRENKRDAIAVPRAPFVQKTEAWLSLALKRMIAYGAEHGFERISWTTGAQQVDRYDLSKRIDSVQYYPATQKLIAIKDNIPVIQREVARENLADFIGKDAADKLLRTKTKKGTGDFAYYGLSGLDLKIGGGGMLAFYDTIVPNVANDVLKKLGGGRVTAFDMLEVLEAGHTPEREPTKNQPGFDITPSLRDRAMQGMALFQPKAAYNPSQLDLAYDQVETRPGTTEEQKSLGIAALKSLFNRNRGDESALQGAADGVQTANLKGGVNRGAINTEQLSDSVETQAQAAHLLGGLDVPSKGSRALTGTDQSTSAKRTSHAPGRDAEILSDAVHTDAFREHGLGGLDVPLQAAVRDLVFAAAENDEVLKSVVPHIPVDVVNMLRLEKLSPEMFLHDAPMFVQALTSGRVGRVHVGFAPLGDLVVSIASFVAKVPSVMQNPVGVPTKRGAAMGAVNGEHTGQKNSIAPLAAQGILSRDRAQGASLLASALWKDFTEHQGAELIGQQVASAEDLALLAQILRDPRFETLRFFFTKGDAVVGHTAVTSRLPGAVAFTSSKEFRESVKSNAPKDEQEALGLKALKETLAGIKAMMDSLEADGYWVLHNHPSGSSTPSSADIRITKRFADNLAGFRGHVVIDQDEYSIIDAGGDTMHRVTRHGSPRGEPELRHDALSQTIDGPGALARVASTLKAKEGFAVMVSTSGRGQVMALAEIPEVALSGATKSLQMRAMARVRRFARMTGSPNGVFVISKNPASLDFLIENHLATDVTGFRDPADPFGRPEISRASLGVKATADLTPKTGILRAEQMQWPQQATLADRIDAILRGESSRAPIYLGETPAVLTRLGMPKLPVGMDESTADKAMFDHGVISREMKVLADAIADPVFVVNSESTIAPAGSLVVVTDLVKSDGRPVIVGIHPGGELARVAANVVASVYPKDNAQRSIVRWVQDGLRYVNNEKRSEWQRLSGVQFPGKLPARSADSIVLTDAEIVKADRAAQWGDDPFQPKVPGILEQNKAPYDVTYTQQQSDANILRQPAAPYGQPPIAGSQTTGDERDSLAANAQSFVRDMLHSDEKFNWWHRTIGTQQHKALSNADFRRVYDESQAFLTDVSKYANEAADMARDLLPKIDSFADFGRKSASKDDIEATTKALYAGTLWGNGSPLTGRVWSDEELRTGRARDGNVTIPVFTGLNDRQAGIYRQTLASVTKSLDEMGKSIIHRLVRVHGIGFDRGMSLDDVVAVVDEKIDDAVVDLSLELERAQEAQDEAGVAKVRREIATLQDTRVAVHDVVEKTKGLQEHGYFPAMRFGRFAIHVVQDRAGGGVDQRYFGTFESQTKANLAARELAKEFPEARLERGVLSVEQARLFQGLSLDALETFAEYITDEDGQPIARDPLVQGFLKAAVGERSALKRHIHRKGVLGYSDDLSRVLASFTVSSARATSSAYHGAEMLRLSNDIRAGDVKDEAIKLVRYLQDPMEEAHALRGFLFAQFLGGSIAHGLVNMTQPFLVTGPYLTQYTSPADAAAKLAQAATTRTERLTGAIGDAYRRAKQEGVVSPQEIHQLRAETGGLPIAKNLALRKLSFLWGSIYSITEQFNRSTTFIASYRIAVEKGMPNPYAFAANAVHETQFVYNRGNRPNWGRGPIGATVMTFKQFSISYLELAQRMFKKDRKAFALMVLMLLAAAGAEGLPFSEDAEDLIDTIGQWMGFATNTKKSLRKWVTAQVGPDMARVVLNGISGLPWMPVDVSVRMGFQNLIPGTGMLKLSEENKARDVIELAGPVGQFVPVEGTMMGRAIERIAKGDLFGAVKSAAPVAVQNVAKGIEMLTTGQARDTKGKKITEVSPGDAVFKMAGLQPAKVARESEIIGEVRQDIAMQKRMESEIAEQWARGIIDAEPDVVRAAMKKMHDWNLDNPSLRVRITSAQIRSRVRQARMSREQRFVRSAAPEIRGQVRRELRD